MADQQIVDELRSARSEGRRPLAPVADLEGANLEGADLWRADLRRADLEGADLEGANLRYANLWNADLVDANLEDANLWYANLEGANLRNANLRNANLEGADLVDANLEGADLRNADLEDANLWRANLVGADLRRANLSTRAHILFAVLPSGYAIYWPTPAGWQMRIGCWTPPKDAYGQAAIDALRDLIATDQHWPEAVGEECDRRRPSLHAWITQCEAHTAYCADLVPNLAAKWGGRS